MYFSIKNGDIPASYVSLPEGEFWGSWPSRENKCNFNHQSKDFSSLPSGEANNFVSLKLDTLQGTTSGGRKFTLVEGLNHDLVYSGST